MHRQEEVILDLVRRSRKLRRMAVDLAEIYRVDFNFLESFTFTLQKIWDQMSVEPIGSNNSGWGVFDTVADIWMGTSSEPLIYEAESVAKAAAQILGVRLKYSPGRLRAKEWTPAGAKLVEELKPQINAEKAIELLEEGLTL